MVVFLKQESKVCSRYNHWRPIRSLTSSFQAHEKRLVAVCTCSTQSILYNCLIGTLLYVFSILLPKSISRNSYAFARTSRVENSNLAWTHGMPALEVYPLDLPLVPCRLPSCRKISNCPIWLSRLFNTRSPFSCLPQRPRQIISTFVVVTCSEICYPDLWLLFPTLGYSIVFPFFGKGEVGASPTPQSAYLLPSLIASSLSRRCLTVWTREWATWSFLRRRQNELCTSPYSSLLFSLPFSFLHSGNIDW